MYLLLPRQDSNPPNKEDPPPPEKKGGMSGLGIFFLVIFILLLIGFALYVVYVHLRARKLGLPTPGWKSLIPFVGDKTRGAGRPNSGIGGWIKSKLPGGGGGGGGGMMGGGSTGYTGAAERSRSTRAQFGQLRQDDDEAWDARGYRGMEVDNELYHAGDQRGRGGYGQGGGATLNPPYGAGDLDEDGEPRRGRSRSRDPPPYGSRGPQQAPPPPTAVRAMSPRPMSGESFGVVGVKGGRGSLDGERRSIFREDM